jgi:hypothetical protein
MSHRIEAHVRITESKYIINALSALGWSYKQVSNTEIQLGNNAALSLRQAQDGSWKIEGDPWYDRGELRKYYGNTLGLVADLQAAYNTEMSKDKLYSMGFYLENEEENQEEIVLTFDNGM